MEFMFESTNYNQIRLEVYERANSGEITEDEKNTLLEAVLMKEINENLVLEAANLDMSVMAKVAAIAAGAVAAAGTIGMLIMKVSSSLKTRDKIKASTELTSVNNDIKKCNSRLRTLQSDLQRTINEYRNSISATEDRAAFYNSRITANTTLMHNYDTGTNDVVRQYQFNNQYDPLKAKEEAQKAAELRKIVTKYMAQKQQLKDEIKKLKHLKSKFLAVVRNNTEDQEYQGIRNQLDQIMANVEQFS